MTRLIANESLPPEHPLDDWAREVNALHARMQAHKARKAVDALFSASDSELNRKDA